MNVKFSILVICTLFLYVNIHSQTIVVNDKLLSQLSKNQAVRVANNNVLTNIFKKQREFYEDMEKKATEITLIEQYIYDNLQKVNNAISDSKQVRYTLQHTTNVMIKLIELSELSAGNIQYSILYTKYYRELLKLVLDIREELKQYTQKVWNRLMDNYDRHFFISRLYDKVRLVEINTNYLIYLIKYAKTKSYMRNVINNTFLNNWVIQDKSIIGSIMIKYNLLKY
ncbi:hypothetical protein [Riemerella columbipharyngis]|uniref:Uncharacterized protein n=1 Tax=Riemerella columbipharyngis TaxID=1071918 RepID=A0A1G6ZAU3_9FLAO|nr:hypothetical protein [Riemerella columbipharyngis]SDD99864.1 hypothetical protein SAMN05421544_10227 [Riemerella columbipharyngis]